MKAAREVRSKLMSFEDMKTESYLINLPPIDNGGNPVTRPFRLCIYQKDHRIESWLIC